MAVTPETFSVFLTKYSQNRKIMDCYLLQGTRRGTPERTLVRCQTFTSKMEFKALLPKQKYKIMAKFTKWPMANHKNTAKTITILHTNEFQPSAFLRMCQKQDHS